MPWNGDPPTADEVLDLLRCMTPGERDRLRDRLEYLDNNPFGNYYLCAKGMVEAFRKAGIEGAKAHLRAVEGIVRAAQELSRHRKGPKAKKERVERRYLQIDLALAAGITETDAIFKFLQEQDPDSIRKGRGLIDPEQMMRRYREARKPKG
jgi:hypothetical protein